MTEPKRLRGDETPEELAALLIDSDYRATIHDVPRDLLVEELAHVMAQNARYEAALKAARELIDAALKGDAR